MTVSCAPGKGEGRGADFSAPSTQPELVLGAALLGVAIFVAEGGYAGPMVTTFFALLCASFSLLLWLVRAASFDLPVGLTWLLGMLAVGALSATSALAAGRAGTQTDLVRDLAILMSYMSFILVGFYFGRDRNAVRLMWWVLIVTGAVTSLVHLWLFTGQITAGVSDVYVLRLRAGRGNQVQLVAVIAACLVMRGCRPGDFSRKLAVALAGVCVVSITLALSRLLLIELVIVAIIFASTRVEDGTTRLRFSPVRALTVVAGGVASLTLVLVILRFISEPAFVFVSEGFLDKLLNSWTEVTSTQQQTAQDIDGTYRAFEADRGTTSFLEAGWFSQWFGQGWGAAVQLGLETASTTSEFTRTEAPFLHNAYINYLVKVGIVGLACYLGFMLRLIHFAVLEPTGGEEPVASARRRQAVLAATLCLGVASLTTGGFGFPSGFFSIALVIGTCLYTDSPPEHDARVPISQTGRRVS